MPEMFFGFGGYGPGVSDGGYGVMVFNKVALFKSENGG